MRRFLQSSKSIPLVIALLTLLAYGLLLPYTGFHWDDWGFAWIAKFLGPAEFIPAFRGFRPFLGPIFFLTTSLIPPVPIYWQIFALIVRFLIGLSTWWTFKAIWPERPRLTLTVALFVLIFPGYSQHWVAFTHINQELIPFIFYLLSFGVTARAIRLTSPATRHSPLISRHPQPVTRHTSLTLLALLLQFVGLFPTEYFFGLEPLRFLFIWFMLDERNFWLRFRRVLMLWLPYLLLWLADSAWLVSLYRSEAYISYGLSTPRDLTPLSILTALGDAVFKAGLYVWVQVLNLAGSTLPAPASLLTFGLAAVTLAFIAPYLLRLSNPQSPITNLQLPITNYQLPTANHHPAPRSSLPTFQPLLLGLAGILLGRLPSLAAGLPLSLGSTFDRFMISMTLGGSLFFAGLIELLFRKNERAKILAFSLIVALGVGQQFFNANLFRRDWARQQEIYWQMAWRIPALEPDTLLLTDQIPNMPFETDLSFTAPVNWIYASDYTRGDLPYALLYTEARLGGGTLPELRENMPVTVPFRTVSFHGSTDSAIAILVPENGCLRVLNPALDDAETYEKQSRYLLDAIPYSNSSRILVDGSQPELPVPPFSPEPAHNWCYFYEKAELARQLQDWEKIVALAREADASGYQPEDVFEWLPFIEAYARTGDVDYAVSLSREAFDGAARVRKGLCHVWQRVQAKVELGGEAEIATRQMLSEFNCTP